MKQLLWGVLVALLIVSCEKDPFQENPQEKPKEEQTDDPKEDPQEQKVCVKLKLDLTESFNDARQWMKAPTKARENNVRFRLCYEIKSDTATQKGVMLHDMSASSIEFEDSLEYGAYRVAIWGNFVTVDASDNVIDEQYSVDDSLGLQKITLLNADQQKDWAFGYAGTCDIEVNELTTKLDIPVRRSVTQIQFARHDPGKDGYWSFREGNSGYPAQIVASNITLQGLCDTYDVYKDSSSVSEPQIYLAAIPNTKGQYYRLTFFETKKDYAINVQYVDERGHTYDHPSYDDDFPIPDYQSRPLARNTLNYIHFEQLGDHYLPNSMLQGYFFPVNIGPLMGDEEIFVQKEGSRVLASDSLALLAVYDSLGGRQWVQPWNIFQPVSTWSGVTLSDKAAGSPQRVVGLQLGRGFVNDCNLAGSVPASLGQLSELQTLVLVAEIDSIYDFLGGLQKLTYLNISNAKSGIVTSSVDQHNPVLRLSGRMPHLKLAKFTHVTFDDFNVLWNCRELLQIDASFVGFPEDYVIDGDFAGMSQLTSFNLGLTSDHEVRISDNLSQLSALRELYLYRCEVNLGALTRGLPELSRIILNVLSYRDTDFPRTITNWKNLTYFDLSFQGWDVELPLSLFTMKNLDKLSLIRTDAKCNVPKKLLVRWTANQWNFKDSPGIRLIDDVTADEGIKLNWTEKNLSGKSGTTDLYVDLYGADASWQITQMPDWVHVSSTRGQGNGVIEFSYDANTSGAQRRGNIQLSSAGKSAACTFVQP